MVKHCNPTLLAMLRTVVSEQQDDWDDQLPALLSAYRSTPHGSTGMSPYHMLYGVKMTMPLDLVIGDVGRERPDVHCPTEYVEWLRGSIRDANAIARANLKKAAKCQKNGYGKTSRSAVFRRGDWVWRVYPPVSGGKLHYRNRGPWLVLAKTGPVAYKIQRHATAEPEFVHIDKLLPYQADFEEELHSWLQGEESDGRRVAEMQTTDKTLSEPPPETALSSPSPTQGGSLDYGLVSDQDADVESKDEEPSTSAIQPRRGL